MDDIKPLGYCVGREAEIEEILRDTSYVFAFRRHWSLAKALNRSKFCIYGATSLKRQDASPSTIDTIAKI